MSKYPIFLQDNENSCGAYCLKMLLNYYKRDDEIKNIKKRCRLCKEGISVYGLIQVLKQYHIEAKAYQCDFKHLEEIQAPAIVHLKQGELYHYVVLYKIKETYFVVGDPAKGLIKMSYEVMSKEFTGILITIHHVGRPIEERESYTLKNFITYHLKQHYQAILSILLKTIIISLLTMIFSYYYQIMIDSFSNYPYLKILLISGGFCLFYVFKLLLDYYRQHHILELSRTLNDEYVSKTMQNMIYQDFQYFQQLEKGALLSERLNDGILEYQENFFQTIQFKIRKMMKNKLAFHYDEYFKNIYNHDEITLAHQIKLESLIQLMIMFSLLIALFLYKKEIMTLGNVMFVYLLLSYMIDPLMKFSLFIAMHDELKIIFERYKEMIPEKKERKRRIKKIKSIELRHVSFSYGYTRPFFDHLQLKIDHSLWIKGKTGSGKSTLLKIIIGQYEPSKGDIYINNYRLQDIDFNSYYQHIKYLDKTPVFYKETLRTNLIFDRQELEEEMKELLYYFKMETFISALDLYLDEAGGFLSSGQAQLMMIIRALLFKPDVLILDEAFSNIDQERLELLMDYLKKQEMIILVVSHQINMMNCFPDYVIIDSGKIVGEEDYGN